MVKKIYIFSLLVIFVLITSSYTFASVSNQEDSAQCTQISESLSNVKGKGLERGTTNPDNECGPIAAGVSQHWFDSKCGLDYSTSSKEDKIKRLTELMETKQNNGTHVGNIYLGINKFLEEEKLDQCFSIYIKTCTNNLYIGNDEYLQPSDIDSSDELDLNCPKAKNIAEELNKRGDVLLFFYQKSVKNSGHFVAVNSIDFWTPGQAEIEVTSDDKHTTMTVDDFENQESSIRESDDTTYTLHTMISVRPDLENPECNFNCPEETGVHNFPDENINDPSFKGGDDLSISRLSCGTNILRSTLTGTSYDVNYCRDYLTPGSKANSLALQFCSETNRRELEQKFANSECSSDCPIKDDVVYRKAPRCSSNEDGSSLFCGWTVTFNCVNPSVDLGYYPAPEFSYSTILIALSISLIGMFLIKRRN